MLQSANTFLVSTPDPDTGKLLDVETVRDQILMHLSNGFNGPSITGDARLAQRSAWLPLEPKETR